MDTAEKLSTTEANTNPCSVFGLNGFDKVNKTLRPSPAEDDFAMHQPGT